MENGVVEVPSRAKLIWNCRRGMLELDLLLTRFVEQHLDQLTENELILFERLLNYTDPELYAYLMGHALPDNEEVKHFVTHIRAQYTL